MSLTGPSVVVISLASQSITHDAPSHLQETNPPFVESMVDFLIESGMRAFRPSLVTNMMGYNAKYEQDIKTMADLAHESALHALA